jgi:hypothetical protein
MPIGAMWPTSVEDLKKADKETLKKLRKQYRLPSNATPEKIWEAMRGVKSGESQSDKEKEANE